MRKRVGEVGRIAVGVLPISKLRTRIRVPGPVIQMLFDPSEMLTWRLRVPSPAKRAGSPPPPARVTPPVRLRDPSGSIVTVPAAFDGMMSPKSRSFTLKKRAGEARWLRPRSEEHTSELQSLMRISYAVFCLKKKKMKQ